MEIRRIAEEDLEAYRHVMSQSFRRGVPNDTTVEKLAEHTRIGGYEGGRLVSVLTIIDFEMIFGARRLACGGIAGVGTDPAHRGRGHAGALLRRSLEVMRERRQVFSSLWPFDHRFYEGYGWECVGYHRSNKIQTRLLPADPESRYVEAVYGPVHEALNPIYEACAARFHGAFTRPPSRWAYHATSANRQPTTYVYRRDGIGEGYVILLWPDDKQKLQAQQFAALTPRAYKGLMGLIHNYAMLAEEFHWWTTPDDAARSVLHHWDLETKIVSGPMSRIVDVQTALSALRPPPDLGGAVVMELIDDQAEWNAGRWRIEASGGSVDVRRTDTEPGITLDIRGLTQAYFGEPSLLQDRIWDRLIVSDEPGFHFLSTLLPPTPVWMTDDF